MRRLNNGFIDFFKDKLNEHLKVHERMGAEREYTCSVCGKVFRNIFPFQAHQRDVHQAGGGAKQKASATTTRSKRARTKGKVWSIIYYC